MVWNDGYVTIVCMLFVEQVRKGNRPNTHLNNVGHDEVNERFFKSTGISLKKKSIEKQVGQVEG